ncbi:hypothetical protein HPB50_026335 [Hyalomma asiaticum]|uniref:Uncharacterized protein n=1 Tax=Hyalomma asiaticum TaxID=266040 RepID=A0ACB7SZA5_HYAAI|nr:hypothetical protein HPB50_026335 [Hyalomma asiaticum]
MQTLMLEPALFQEIEYIITEDNTIVSTDFGGDVRIWDSNTGECVNILNRRKSRLRRSKQENYTLRASGSFSSDSTYGSSPTDSCDFGLSSQASREHPPEFFVGQSSPAGLSPGTATEDARSKGYDFSRQVWHGMLFVTPYLQMPSSPREADDRESAVHQVMEPSNAGEEPSLMTAAGGDAPGGGSSHTAASSVEFQPIWCMGCYSHWLVVGCQNGRIEPGASTAVSGCQDGLVCVWDLMTGTCAYSLTAHRGAVLSLRTTGLYLLSLGSDSRLRIWDKSQGHLLHTLYQDHLVLWDLNQGEAVQVVMLGPGDSGVAVHQVHCTSDAVVCDYGHSLCVVYFPALSTKFD